MQYISILLQQEEEAIHKISIIHKGNISTHHTWKENTEQYNTYAHYTLDQEVPAPHKWDNRTEVEATGFTPAKKTSSSLDPEKTKISKKEQ